MDEKCFFKTAYLGGKMQVTSFDFDTFNETTLVSLDVGPVEDYLRFSTIVDVRPL